MLVLTQCLEKKFSAKPGINQDTKLSATLGANSKHIIEEPKFQI